MCAEFPAREPRKIDEGQGWHGYRTDLVKACRGLEGAVVRQAQEVIAVNLIPTAARIGWQLIGQVQFFSSLILFPTAERVGMAKF